MRTKPHRGLSREYADIIANQKLKSTLFNV